jgi:hypothetical protein
VWAFWSLRDKHDWLAAITQRRRNLVFICRNGNLGVTFHELRTWPLSEVRQMVADINYWIVIEQKAAQNG